MTVTNSNGAVDNDSVTITVFNNEAPTANASAVTQAYEGATVTLDGSASSDSDGSIIAYLWEQTAGPTASIADPAAKNTSFHAPAVDDDTVLTFRLKVTDDVGYQDSDEISITIVYNNPPSASAGADTQVNENASVELDGSASSDVEDNNLIYFWQQVDSSGYSVSLSDANISTPTFTTPQVAADTSLIFQLTVTDSLGKSSAANVTITIVYNSPPTANAGNNQQVNENQLVELDGSASSDVEDSNLTYLWQQVDSSGYSVSLSDANISTPTFTTPEVAANTELIFQLTVTDNLGKSSDANVTISITYNNPPAAHVGNDQEANEGVRIQLDGSASSDIESSSLAYSWQQIDDSAYSITLANPATAQPSFTTPIVAADTNLIFQLTVTDSLGKSSNANTIISITYNNPPIAQVGADQEVEEGATVQLDGSASSDIEDAILSYLWQQVDSSGYVIELSDANSAKPSFTTPEVAADTDLIFQLTVTDSLGKSSDANSTISVIYNTPPVAQVGANQIVYEGENVQLDASSSSDSDGSIASYSWLQFDDSGYFITLTNPETAQPSFIAPEVLTETYIIFQLTVTDDLGKSSDANVIITVLDNAPPVAAVVTVTTQANEGETVQLDGSASSDTEDSSLNYSWQQVDNSGYSINLNGATTAQPTFTTPIVSANTDLIFQLTVTDSLGKSSDANATVSIIYNSPPSANAGANQSFYEGESVELNGSASSDIEDSSLAYSWQQVDDSAYSVTLANPATARPSFTTPEVFTDTNLIFQLTVTDSLGKSSDANVTITVFDNIPPTASAGADQSVYEGTSVALDASGSSDSDGSIASYSWQQVDSSGYTAALIDADSATPSFTAPEVAADTELIFELTVTDNNGDQDSDTVVIAIKDNNPPSANAGSDQSVNEGAIVQLNGSASSDSEDSTLGYSWQQVDSSGYTAALIDADSATPSFTAPNPVAADTDLIFQLTVTDSLGKSDDANVSITVIYNAPPIANTGADQSVYEGTIVQLDGSASSDFEDEDSSLTYLWEQSDSSGYSVTLSDGNSVNPTFTAPEVPADTNLIFQLTVTNSLGKTGQDTVTITVLHIPPLVVDAGIDNNQSAGTIANLRGSVSGGAEFIASYLWQETTSYGITIERADSVNASFIVPESLAVGDVLSFQLIVTDSAGISASAATSITIAEPGTFKWFYERSSKVRSSPAIGPDGTVYFGADDGKFYALNPQDGSLKWSFITGGAIDTPPTIDADGTLYFGSDDNHLYAVSPPTDGSQSGVEKWRYDNGDVFDEHSSVSIAADGTLYFGSRDDHLYALDPDGNLQWSYAVGGAIIAAPAIGSEGTIYFGSGNDRSIHAINPPSDGGSTGELYWSYDADSSFLTWTSPAIGADGSVYNGSRGDYFHALNPEDGSLKWRHGAGDDVLASPAIAADGTVYFGSRDDYLYAFEPDGNEKWRYQTGGSLDSSPAIGADGTVYFGNNDDYVYALDPDGKEQWHYYLGSKVNYSSAALAPDGTLFIGADFGFYAIHTASAGLMNSPWPKFGQNNRSTGRVNIAPSADAGSEQTVNPGATVNLDASASTDPDGAIIDYYWRETSGYGINIIGNSSAQASFTAPTPSANDTLSIELTVTDNHGTTTTTTTLNINIEI